MVPVRPEWIEATVAWHVAQAATCAATCPVSLVSLVSPPFLYHALHHARWTGHYGFASAGLDGLLGTEFPDWRALHDRILAGRPLESLKTRGDGG